MKVDIAVLNQIKKSLSAEEISEYWQIRLFNQCKKFIKAAKGHLFKIKLTLLKMKYIVTLPARGNVDVAFKDRTAALMATNHFSKLYACFLGKK